METTTLCYIERAGQYLMLHRVKKECDVNRDKWVGIGGHIEPGETPEQCLLREVRQETGLTLTRYRACGEICFESAPWPPELMYLYHADGFTRASCSRATRVSWFGWTGPCCGRCRPGRAISSFWS